MSGVLPLVIRDLRFAVEDRTILERVDARIVSSGITALVGPNGAGKSVLLRLIDGLLRPTGGTIRMGASHARPVRRALVFQRPSLIRASAARNVELALTPLKLSRGERKARVGTALARVGLAERAADPATKLSGGEQQRLALARAWAAEPDLLLLDEPTANLDPAATETIERLIGAMARAGTKVVLVSHNVGQVARLAEDVIVLSAGRTVEHGSTHQVIHTPRSAEARAFLAGELPWTTFAAAC